MTANSAPSPLRGFAPQSAVMRSVDSSQASPLRMPRCRQWPTTGTLIQPLLCLWRRTWAREVSSDLPPTRCQEKTARIGREQPFGCETSAGGDCNTGGFLLRFFWEKNTPQLNLVSENFGSAASDATGLIVPLNKHYCKQLVPAAGDGSPLSVPGALTRLGVTLGLLS